MVDDIGPRVPEDTESLGPRVNRVVATINGVDIYQSDLSFALTVLGAISLAAHWLSSE